MATNIEMNIFNSDNSYTTLYPKTDYNLLENKPTLVTSYNQLTDKPTIPTVPSLPLSVNNGGTGVTSLDTLKVNLGYKFKISSTLQSYIGDGQSSRSISIAGWTSDTKKPIFIEVCNLDSGLPKSGTYYASVSIGQEAPVLGYSSSYIGWSAGQQIYTLDDKTVYIKSANLNKTGVNYALGATIIELI